MIAEVLPSFFLYGEPQEFVYPDFIHVEELAVRSRPSGWTIHPHVHKDLSHLIVIARGGGRICFESRLTDFRGAQVIIVPARLAHGFEWQPESTGMVLTIADPHLAQLHERHCELAKLFASPRFAAMSPADCRLVIASMESLRRELSWANLGQAAAIEAALLTIMVHTIRAIRLSEVGEQPDGRQSNLVARFRQLVDQRYRTREPVEIYARTLAVSPTTLRQACAATGSSPIAIRDQRAILEAQRLLAYSNRTVAEIGYTIGIPDPAYFTRFFTRKCGLPPALWRKKVGRRGETDAALRTGS